MVALLVLPISLSAGAKALRLFDSSNIENGLVVVNRNTFLFSSIEGQINALPDDTTGFVCPDDISIYTDLNSCDALITSGLSIRDPYNNIRSLSWQMQGATNAQSPTLGINQLHSYTFNEGSTFVTYYIQDSQGRSFNCTFEVVVTDNQSPRFISSPGDINVSNNQGDCYARVSWSEPVIIDNCTRSDQMIVESSYTPGDIFPVGTTEVIYRASDGLNQVEHSFNITVTDDVRPYLVAPNPKVIVCGEEVEDAFTTWEQFKKAGGVVSDNCEVDYKSFRYISQKSSDIHCPYIITRTYSIADINGNIAEVSRLIEVTGEEPQVDAEHADRSEPVLKSGTGATSVTITLVGKVDVSCYGGTDGSIDLDTASTNGPVTSILWSPGGQTTLDVSGLSAGNYSVTVTDGDGSNSLNVTITQPAILSASGSQTQGVSCYGGSDGIAAVTVSGGTPPYNISPSRAAATPSTMDVGTWITSATSTSGSSARTSRASA